MGSKRIGEALRALRARQPGWAPDWQLFLTLAGDAEEHPADDVLASAGLPPIVDWSIRSRRGFGQIVSGVLTDQHDQPLWDQPLIRPAVATELPGAVIVPWTSSGGLRVGLLTEYRPLIATPEGQGAFIRAFPRGYALSGEGFEETARRELLEETGLEAVSVVEIGRVVSDTAWMSRAVPVFAAEIRDPLDAEFDGSHEGIVRFVWEPVARLLERRDLLCGFSLSGLAFFLGFATERQLIQIAQG